MKEGKSPANPINESEYRKRLRLTARLIDYTAELQNIGLGQQLLDDLKKYASTHVDTEERLRRMLGNFDKKPNGVEQELMALFAKYDNLMKQCKSDQERRALGSIGVMEVSRLLDGNNLGGGKLTIDGSTIKEG